MQQTTMNFTPFDQLANAFWDLLTNCDHSVLALGLALALSMVVTLAASAFLFEADSASGAAGSATLAAVGTVVIGVLSKILHAKTSLVLAPALILGACVGLGTVMWLFERKSKREMSGRH